jgi:hypothetical protein
MAELTDTDRDLMATYRDGVARVERALANFTDQELDRPAGDDQWTARMVVHHLADSETHSYIRLRQLLVEPAPADIQGYDEAHWAESAVLGYRTQPLDLSLDVFRAVRAASSDLLARIVPSDLDREGRHSESGAYTLRTWLELYAAHAVEHADQIDRARTGSPSVKSRGS